MAYFLRMEPPKKKRGRPPKENKEKVWVAKNISLTQEDAESLRILAGRLSRHLDARSPSSFITHGESWTARALIRFAAEQTKDWKYGKECPFLDTLLDIGGDIQTIGL